MIQTYEFTEEERQILSAMINSDLKHINDGIRSYDDKDDVGLIDFEIQRKLRIKRKILETLSAKLNQ